MIITFVLKLLEWRVHVQADPKRANVLILNPFLNSRPDGHVVSALPDSNADVLLSHSQQPSDVSNVAAHDDNDAEPGVPPATRSHAPSRAGLVRVRVPSSSAPSNAQRLPERPRWPELTEDAEQLGRLLLQAILKWERVICYLVPSKQEHTCK